MSSPEEVVAAVERVGEISRHACRVDVLARFSAEVMVDRTLTLFAAIVSRRSER